MKITFEGTYYEDILTQMANVLAATARQATSTTNSKFVADEFKNVGLASAQGPGPDVFADMGLNPVETPVVKPANKPEAKTTKARSAKQLENDERLRNLAVEKAAKRQSANQPKSTSEPEPKKAAPPPKTAEGMNPAEVVALRTKTIAELQEAYANGHQKEVFELLSRFGNGAKSFRELPAESFVPIREAIDAGALA